MKYILYRLFEQIGDADVDDSDVEPELVAVEYGNSLSEVADALAYDAEDALNEAYEGCDCESERPTAPDDLEFLGEEYLYQIVGSVGDQTLVYFGVLVED